MDGIIAGAILTGLFLLLLTLVLGDFNRRLDRLEMKEIARENRENREKGKQ